MLATGGNECIQPGICLICQPTMNLIYQQGTDLFQLATPPKRIISIVPSQTELLYDLGLNDEVIGITKFCVHPASWFQSKTRIGGTKQLNLPLIESLGPDLVLANKEENVKEQVEAVARFCPVWCSNIRSMPEAFEMIETIGHITGKGQNARSITATIREDLRPFMATEKKRRAAYLIWQKPYMTAGGDTFINTMMQAAGFENVFAARSRYPEVSMHDLINAGAEMILFSSEPFPFKEKHVSAFAEEWQQISNVVPHLKIVDGEIFSWYGSRLLHAAGYLRKLNHDLLLQN
jgi:ABC-type Fe3+-hydroxamate transport system substrate-binding protein